MKKVVILSICLSLSVLTAACGHGWKHNTIPAAKWDKDYADCVHQAESATQGSRMDKDPAQNWGAYGQVRYRTDKCMEDKGYFQAGDRE